MMPIQNPTQYKREKIACPAAAPFDMFVGHEKQCQRNHGQTLKRIAERGGFSPCEAVAVLEDRRYTSIPHEESVRQLEAYVERYTADVKPAWTKEQYRAARDALFAQEGACNGSGVAHSLVEAYKAWLHTYGTEAANISAPVVLMLHQLAHLARMSFEGPPDDSDWYHRATETCKRIVKEYEEAHPG